MAKEIFACLGVIGILSGCQTMPDYTVSKAYDGNWKGGRIDVSGLSMCKPTMILGNIQDGFINLRLDYNGTSLTGWMPEKGEFKLHSSGPWVYKFKGQAGGVTIYGDWSVVGAACKGTWTVSRS